MINSKISIIIPVFNSSKTIERCVKSVLEQQGYDDYEIIVVDDGSNDDTVSLVERFSKPSIRIVHQSHKGVSAARNLGVKKATGDYIMFMDSDDTLNKDALLLLSKKISGRKDFDVIKFGYDVIDHGEKTEKSMFKLSGRIIDSSDEDDYELLIDNFFRNKEVIPCFSVTLLLSKSFILYNNLLFDETKYMMEDAIYYLDIFDYGAKIYFYDKVLYDVYVNINSVTRSDDTAMRMLKGTVASANEILERTGHDGSICYKYLTLIVEYMMRYIRVNRKMNSYFFCDEIKAIVRDADVKNSNVFWGIIKRAILTNNHLAIKCLSFIYNFKKRMKG